MNEQEAKPRGGLRAALLGDVDARAAAADAKLDRKFRKRQLKRDNASQDRDVAKQKRAARLATFRAGVVNGAKTAVVVGPITAPMAVAWTGQIGFATSVLAWPFVGGVLYAAAYELTTVFCGWLYHEARKDGDGGIPYRLAMWAFAFGAAAQQWWHYLNPDGSASYRSVTFASMTLVGVIVFELFARLVHRRTLRRKGKVDDSRPRFGLMRWLRYPRRTFDAWSLTIQQPTRFNTVDLAWSAADQAATARVRQRSVRRLARSGPYGRGRAVELEGSSREDWRSVAGTGGVYEVSSLGNVRSWTRSKRGRLLKASPNVSTGYLKVDVPRTRPVHQLVAEAFHGPRPEGAQVCHNDGNKLNNAASNLRWDTPAANAQDRVEHAALNQPSEQATEDSEQLDTEFEPTDLERQAVAVLAQAGQAINRANCADAVRDLDGAISTKRASELAAWGRSNSGRRGPRAV